MKVYETYVFDLYGTLVDIKTDESSVGLWKSFSDILNEYGMKFTHQDLKKLYERKCLAEAHRMDRLIRDKQLPGPSEINILNVWQEIAKESDIFLSEHQLNHISEVFRKLSIRKLQLFDGAGELLEHLKSHNRQLVLLTNAQASFTGAELRDLGIGRMFDRVIISSDCGVKKPSPAIYARLWVSGQIPETSVMIGNDDICDCWGAAKAGMDSMYIHTGQSPELSGPLPANCRIISSLSDVLPTE